MWIACQNGHLEIVQWLLTHGADTDVMRPTWYGMTPMDIACQQGHLNIVQHLIHHHRMPHCTLTPWHPRLSYSNKRQLHQAARENVFACQSYFTLATIICDIDIEQYKVLEETGHLVVPGSSILRFRRFNNAKRRLLWMVASFICGGKDARQMWCLIRNVRT